MIRRKFYADIEPPLTKTSFIFPQPWPPTKACEPGMARYEFEVEFAEAIVVLAIKNVS